MRPENIPDAVILAYILTAADRTRAKAAGDPNTCSRADAMVARYRARLTALGALARIEGRERE